MNNGTSPDDASAGNHRKPVLIMAIAALLLLLVTENAHAGKIAAFYLEPHLGVARVMMKAFEIERSFVTVVGQKNSQYTWTDVNLSAEGGIAPVGRVINYQGTGVEMGFGTGIKISGLKLGFTLTFINATFSGASKRYQYYPEQLRAEGKKFSDTDRAPIVRMMGAVKYGVPIGRFLLQFQTRVGRMAFGHTSLILGRAAEKDNGLTADAGIELTLRPSRWFSVGFLGYGGFFAFLGDGKYAAGMGALFGGNGTFCLYF